MPWEQSVDVARLEIHDLIDAAYDRIDAIWSAENPLLVKYLHEQANDAERARLVEEVEEPYNSLIFNLRPSEAEDLDTWRNQSLEMVEAWPDDAKQLALSTIKCVCIKDVRHKYITSTDELVALNDRLAIAIKEERSRSFVYHPYCKAGIQLFIKSHGQTKTIFLGDMTASGAVGGWDSEDLASSIDEVIAYRDFSGFRDIPELI